MTQLRLQSYLKFLKFQFILWHEVRKVIQNGVLSNFYSNQLSRSPFGLLEAELINVVVF
jgi:hypothetical protein